MSALPVVRRTREEVVKLWVAALRSGEYEQAQGQLWSGDGFCCLGVLCDLAARDGGPQWEGDRFASSSAHPEIAMWSWVVGRGQGRDAGALSERLMEANDRQLKTFRQIASIIEEELL